MKDFEKKILEILHSNKSEASKITELNEVLQSITELSFGPFLNLNLNDSDVILLAKALEQNNTLVSLNLEAQHIGSEVMQAIAQVLLLNPTLKNLYLGFCKIDSAGALILAEALKTNQTLNSLDLSYNSHIGPEGAKALANMLTVNQTLTNVDLRHTWHGSRSTEKAFAEMLTKNHTLKSLDLGQTLIGYAGSKILEAALKTNRTLIKLELDDFQLIHSPLFGVSLKKINACLKRNRHLPLKKSEKLDTALGALPPDLVNIVKEYADLPIIKKIKKEPRKPSIFQQAWEKIYHFFKPIEKLTPSDTTRDLDLKQNSDHPPQNAPSPVDSTKKVISNEPNKSSPSLKQEGEVSKNRLT